MKRACRICLVCILALSLCLPAFASGLRQEGKDVPATYVAGSVSDTGVIYAVELNWGTIGALKYTGTSTIYRWDAENHKYVADSSSGDEWTTDSTSISITVTNHSNAGIKATATYVDEDSDSLTTTAEWTAQSVTCPSAAAGIVNYVGTGTATSGTISGTVKVTAGTISDDTDSVGTITITIEAA